MKKKRSSYVTRGLTLLVLSLLLLSLAVISPSDVLQTSGETDTQETIDFRVLSTSDIHGQVTAFNYETGEADPKTGLSKIATLVKKERSAAGKNNTLLIDAGDSFYSYSTNYIYDNYPDAVQPIYQAMNLMGYDGITLGNHDFDHPWDYLYDQLDRSGLLDRTFVSNAVYTESGEQPFRSSAILTRKMKTSEGRTVKVKIGIVGATYTSFSQRRYRYSGFLDGLDIYQTVKAESEQLKAQGADIVVAFIHGGVGLLSGANTTTHAGARLAKLPSVDAVVCSHSHETFPSTDGTFAGISNVDEEKGTIYGTPVVQAGSHAEALGVIRLTLSVSPDGKITVADGSSSVRRVTASTKEDAGIVDLFAPYQQILDNVLDRTEYRIAEGLTYTNADCFIQDSALYQLMNNAKLYYASGYVAQYAPEYSSWPMLAVTVNRLDSRAQTIELSGSLTEQDISALLAESSGERASGYVHIYKLTGENLMEWLEFNASIYGTVGTALPELLSDFAAKNPDVSSLLREENLRDWKEFYSFDGISYDIDLSVAPRYNSKGRLLNYTNRIKNLTYQGNPVTKDMNFLITMDSVETRYKFMPVDADTIFTRWLYTTSHDVLMDYIKKLSSFGPLAVKADNNWHLVAPDGYRFVAAIPKIHHDYVTGQDWYSKKVKNGSLYYYYLGTPVNKAQTVSAATAPQVIVPTNHTIPVRVFAHTAPDASIQEILVIYGNVRSVSNERWKTDALTVENNMIYAPKNGKYSVRVTDSRGQKTITHFVIDNYSKTAMETPFVQLMTNRLSAVRGTATPYSNIHVAMPDGTILTGLVDENGNFDIQIPIPRAYDLYTIWATFGKRVSLPVEMSVKKTGANVPTANAFHAGDTVLTGKTDPYVTLSLRLGKTIYVAEGEKEAYKKSSIYSASHVLKETTITVAEDGTFEIQLPVAAESGQTWLLYATDRNGNASRAVYVNVP
ncbi:MAG: 5'-nucleotidase C-terminal domain-containing protein [Lachnospiraceae bacterium]|nr:5'-nucleotidase C-terminal domain-containing protein [Lachnospiraceae bacterium]